MDHENSMFLLLLLGQAVILIFQFGFLNILNVILLVVCWAQNVFGKQRCGFLPVRFQGEGQMDASILQNPYFLEGYSI